MPFKLPDFIEETGISKIREKSSGEDASKSLKQRMRERMQPKMGKIDIDYQTLHNAFFKFQKKPQTTTHGEIYYEGKEYEIRMKEFKPGRVSPQLRQALGISEGAPPPWLYNMQRYGPPPSYANLKVPGVNMILPISEGKLFQDERGFTIYADCHGLNKAVYQRRLVKRPLWGMLKQEKAFADIEEQESYDEEEESEEEDHGLEDYSDEPEEELNANTDFLDGTDIQDLYSGV